MIFAVSDPSPLTVCINYSLLHIHCESKKQGTTILSTTSPNVESDFQIFSLTDSLVNMQQNRTAQKGSNCVIVPNFVDIGQTAAEIWRFFDFSKMAAVRHLGFSKVGSLYG